MNKPLKPVNLTLNDVTIDDIENHKIISDNELIRDFTNLIKLNVSENKNSFAGNTILYHFQLKNLLNCKRSDGKTIYDVYNDPIEWNTLIEQTKKRNRGGKTAAGNVFECFRINRGAVVMFKASTAKYLYKKYNATSILDPTAGWGGRLLGAWALNLNYTGIDTNIELQSSYNKMIEFLSMNFKSESKYQMIWKDCLLVDFSKIKYDFVLTSPPYLNLELYEHMPIWKSQDLFYIKFFMPLFEKCISNIKKGGHICFNISPKMYSDAIKFGLPKSDIEEPLKQQLGQKHEKINIGKKQQDKIYIWRV